MCVCGGGKQRGRASNLPLGQPSQQIMSPPYEHIAQMSSFSFPSFHFCLITSRLSSSSSTKSTTSRVFSATVLCSAFRGTARFLLFLAALSGWEGARASILSNILLSITSLLAFDSNAFLLLLSFILILHRSTSTRRYFRSVCLSVTVAVFSRYVEIALWVFFPRRPVKLNFHSVLLAFHHQFTCLYASIMWFYNPMYPGRNVPGTTDGNLFL